MVPARLALAVGVAAAVILSAPFISLIRNSVRDRFPEHFLLILGVAMAVCVAAALLVAVARIRSHRFVRYGGIASAAVIATVYSLLTASPDPQVAAVERFHFVEYGLLTFLFYRAWRPLDDAGMLMLAALAAMWTATLEEWFQWFIPGRVGTVEDVLLNGVAIACGLLFSVGLDPPARARGWPDRRSRRHIGTTAALFVIVFGLFFDSVHLGHRIADPERGAFMSLFTARELHEAAGDRAARWAAHPPVDRTRLAREDQYRTEGLQHVQARNRAWDRGDFAAAWCENAILEGYYAPVLDRGHRWPAAQRADAEQRGARDALPASFVSDAYPYDVHAWPRWRFWAVVLTIAAALFTTLR